MFSRIQSAQLSGVSAQGVLVETDLTRGLYLFQIVGLADKAVEESRERVIAALRNSVSVNPKANNEKIIVSLSPAAVRKEGAYFDLAIAVGYLVASGTLNEIEMGGKAFVGALALNGDVQPVQGILPIARWAAAHEIRELYLPAQNAREAALIDGDIQIIPVPTLADLVQHLKGAVPLDCLRYTPPPALHAADTIHEIDFADIRGQSSAKRALMIAAAGGHNVILYGPPGTGKTMLSKAFHSIMPPLDHDAFLEVATIYSSAGFTDTIYDGMPPIRSPHHTASPTAVIGGGSTIRPGDITLSHHGILYLDEFPEFDRRIIEALREPLEEGCITIARSKGTHRFPARFLLLAAMNPCPCGYRGSGVQPCICTGADIARYNKKLSGPIMDRIDLWVPVSNIAYETLHESAPEKESPAVTQRVISARALQLARAKKMNSLLTAAEVRTTACLTADATTRLQEYAARLRLSPRAYLRTIKVAQTIADLAHSETISVDHVLEALQYRHKME